MRRRKAVVKVSETVGTIHYNNVHIVTLPVTMEEAVGLGSVRWLVVNGNPEDCELADAWLAVDVVAITVSI